MVLILPGPAGYLLGDSRDWGGGGVPARRAPPPQEPRIPTQLGPCPPPTALRRPPSADRVHRPQVRGPGAALPPRRRSAFLVE